MTTEAVWKRGGSLLVALAVALGGCAVKGSGKPFALRPPPAGEARVYHYRVHHTFLASALAWDVLSNGQPLTRIGNGGYFAETVAPGRVRYLTRTNRDAGLYGIAATALSNALADFQESHVLDAAADSTYFLRWRFDASMSDPVIEAMDPATALSEMDGLLAFPPLTVDPDR
ncbi:MAG: DUF2846 domain-containing protein [Zoogloeaceae bacterium]|nr:DUF2846 domain-containing protein [Rhodocyclaceae bacterium]MCP5236282.1 DUF2846 domain-containing protein [Zoogloeaceae bacterium]